MGAGETAMFLTACLGRTKSRQRFLEPGSKAYRTVQFLESGQRSLPKQQSNQRKTNLTSPAGGQRQAVRRTGPFGEFPNGAVAQLVER